MSPNFCTQCGARLSGPARFCGKCGAPITDPSSAPRTEVPFTPPSRTANPQQTAKTFASPPASASPTTPPSYPVARPEIPKPAAPAGQPVNAPAQTVPSFSPPPVAQPRPAETSTRPAGRGAMDSLMSLAPGLAIQLFQNGSAYLANPAMAARFLLPCVVSVVSVALAPKLGKWVAVLVMLPALIYMLIPLVSGLSGGGDASSMVQTHAGRGLVSMSMFYMLMNLLRSRRR